MSAHFPERILVKWDDWKQKGRFSSDLSLERSIEGAGNIPVKPDIRAAFAWLFDLTHQGQMWIRGNKLNDNFQLVVVGYGPEVVEICSWRTMRQVRKAWFKLWCDVRMAGTPEHQRLLEIFKHKFLRKMQGGLIRQERSPRISRTVREYARHKVDRMTSEHLEPNLDLMDVRL